MGKKHPLMTKINISRQFSRYNSAALTLRAQNANAKNISSLTVYQNTSRKSLEYPSMSNNHLTMPQYNFTAVKQFTVMTIVWGIFGMLVGVIIAA
ncbi:MAG: hypothetical protein COA99_16070, partial [Moraxellaceae bacterium]